MRDLNAIRDTNLEATLGPYASVGDIARYLEQEHADMEQARKTYQERRCKEYHAGLRSDPGYCNEPWGPSEPWPRLKADRHNRGWPKAKQSKQVSDRIPGQDK